MAVLLSLKLSSYFKWRTRQVWTALITITKITKVHVFIRTTLSWRVCQYIWQTGLRLFYLQVFQFIVVDLFNKWRAFHNEDNSDVYFDIFTSFAMYVKRKCLLAAFGSIPFCTMALRRQSRSRHQLDYLNGSSQTTMMLTRECTSLRSRRTFNAPPQKCRFRHKLNKLQPEPDYPQR